MILSGPIAAIATLLGLAMPEIKVYVTLWGVVVLLLDLLVFTPWQKKLRENGAKVQELFDCGVFQMPWSEIKAGKKPDAELIHAHARRYDVAFDVPAPRSNWYPVCVDSVSPEIGVVICQRANVYWDSKLRRLYAMNVAAIALAFTAILICVAVHDKTSFPDFFAYVVVPMTSAYVLAYRQFTEHRDAADRLDKLKDHADKLFGDAAAGAAANSIAARSRTLQDEIFDGRKRNPPVFDFIFKRLRQQGEFEMNKGAESLVKEVRANNG
jgi:hypothetical protein